MNLADQYHKEILKMLKEQTASLEKTLSSVKIMNKKQRETILRMNNLTEEILKESKRQSILLEGKEITKTISNLNDTAEEILKESKRQKSMLLEDERKNSRWGEQHEQCNYGDKA